MSLHGDYDPDNIFAKILRGDLPAVKVFEDDKTLAFMDVFPQTKGHVLVIPKAPSRNMLEADPKDLTHTILQTQAIAKAVDKALSPDGMIITQFNGAPAGQTVFHLHFHIIPKYDGKSMGDHAKGKMADMDALESLAKKIRAAL